MLLLGWKVWREAERQKQDRVGLERRLENEKEKLSLWFWTLVVSLEVVDKPTTFEVLMMWVCGTLAAAPPSLPPRVGCSF